MVPRISADEAVEFLKIHQIRKENKILYEEVQALRDEVKACHRTHEQIQEKLNAVQQTSGHDNAGLTEHLTKLNTLDASVQRVLERVIECEATDKQLREKLEHHSADLVNASVKTGENVDAVIREVTEFRTRFEQRMSALETSVAQLDESIERNVGSLCRPQLNFMQQSLEHSYPRITAPTHSQADMSEHVVSESGTILVPASEFSRQSSWYMLMQFAASCLGYSSPELPAVQAHETSSSEDSEDILQDDDMLLDFDDVEVIPDAPGANCLPQKEACTRAAPIVDHNHMEKIASVSGTDTQETGPNLQTKLEILLELAQLKQHGTETILTYLQRLKARTCKLPQHTYSARIYLKRFLAGLEEQQNRVIMRQWLEKSQWSIEDAEDCAMLLDAVIESGVQGDTSQPEVDPLASGFYQTQCEDPAIQNEPKQVQMMSEEEDGARQVASNNEHSSENVVRDHDAQGQPQERVMPARKCKRKIELEQPRSCKNAAADRRGHGSAGLTSTRNNDQNSRMSWTRDRDEAGRFVSSLHRAQTDHEVASDNAAQQTNQKSATTHAQFSEEDHPEQQSTSKLKPRPKDLQLKPSLVPSKGAARRPTGLVSDNVERGSFQDSTRPQKRRRRSQIP